MMAMYCEVLAPYLNLFSIYRWSNLLCALGCATRWLDGLLFDLIFNYIDGLNKTRSIFTFMYTTRRMHKSKDID